MIQPCALHHKKISTNITTGYGTVIIVMQMLRFDSLEPLSGTLYDDVNRDNF